MFSGLGVWWCSLKGSAVRSWGWTSSSRSLLQTSVTWTRSQNFGCLFKVTQLPRAARRGWALPKMCLLKMFTELSPKNGSGPKYPLKLRLRSKSSSVTCCFLLLVIQQETFPGSHCSRLVPGSRYRQGMCVVRSHQTFFRLCFSFGTFCPNRFVHL